MSIESYPPPLGDIFPFFSNRDAHTNVGDSEHPGGMTSYCSAKAKYSDEQGEFAPNFWSNVAYTTGEGSGSYVQRMSFILIIPPPPSSL